jgi:hypothetical protein
MPENLAKDLTNEFQDQIITSKEELEEIRQIIEK